MRNYCLYRHFDAQGTLLYVGISAGVIQRITSHQQGSVWFKQIAIIKLEHFETHQEALDAEYQAIMTERPIHNRQHWTRYLAEKDMEDYIEYIARED